MGKEKNIETNQKHKHYKRILKITGMELKEHAPFTVLGAFAGILFLAFLFVKYRKIFLCQNE